MHVPIGQTESRPQASHSVRLYGLDASGRPFNTTVIVRSLTESGAVLGDVVVPLQVGDLIGVQRGPHKGKCRVQWVGSPDTANYGDLGVQSEDGCHVLSLETLASSVVAGVDSERRVILAQPPAVERRSATRYGCDLGVEIGTPGSEVRMWSRCTDISLGGCYIETLAPMPVGSSMDIKLMLETEALNVEGIVRTSFPGMGMGVELVFKSSQPVQELRRYLQRKFHAPGSREAPQRVSGTPAILECLEKILAWGATARLQEADRHSFDALASSLQHELQFLRGSEPGQHGT